MEEEFDINIRINKDNLKFSLAKLVYDIERSLDNGLFTKTYFRRSFNIEEEYNQAMRCTDYVVTAKYVKHEDS